MSGKSYYECHITMIGDPETIKPKVERLKWKFSAIDGDPTLGDGIKCYATRHFNARMDRDIVQDLLDGAAEVLAQSVDVVRRKIELVLYDSRIETVSA